MAVALLVSGGQAEAAIKHQVTAREAGATTGFWTPERMDRALSRDPAFGFLPETDGTARPETRHRPVTVFRPEVGKILGWHRYGPYSCTGSVIETRSLRLVLTAAHCLFYAGSWARRILFIPDFKNGSLPYGVYKTKALWIPYRWPRHSFGITGTHFDIGLIVTRKRWNGSRIGENVGAIPIQTYPRRRGLTDIYGYPGGSMRGRVMRTCRSWTRPWSGSWFLPGPVGMISRCNMAPGSSGGPWVSRYPRQGGGTVGVVDGLTSTGGKIGRRSFLTSPYLGRVLVSLIRDTEGR